VSYDESFLSLYLSPLSTYLSQVDVTDIYINQPREIWIERLSGALEYVVVPELTDALLWRLSRQIAGQSNQGISRRHPLLAAWLNDGSRVQIITPPATRSSVVIAIRRHVIPDLNINDYVNDGAFKGTVCGEPSEAKESSMLAAYDARDWGEFLRRAVELRKTIVISGGTSSGNSLMPLFVQFHWKSGLYSLRILRRFELRTPIPLD
jgi:type IV secretion system protein VirB11